METQVIVGIDLSMARLDVAPGCHKQARGETDQRMTAPGTGSWRSRHLQKRSAVKATPASFGSRADLDLLRG